MLEPQNRQLLLESLKPPEGFELDQAFGTTYSLDLHTLLTAPIAFTLFDWGGEEGAAIRDPLALLESLRRYAGRLAVFCQAGEIHVPKRQERLFAYLEDSVFELQPPNGGVFHPKVWVLRFVDDEGTVIYRLLCLSRNLTFDRSWDTVLVLDGELQNRTNAYSGNHPLGDFVQALPAMATGKLPKEWLDKIELMQHELRRVAFEPPPGVEEVRFWPMGIPNSRRLKFEPESRPMLVVSPFLADDYLADLTVGNRAAKLVTRLDTAEALNPEVLAKFEDVFVLADEATPEPEDKEETSDETLYGLHAKLFVMDDGRRSRMWTGSANATRAAFHHNVEFLVELVGRRKHLGIEALLAQVQGEARFRDLLQEFRPREDREEPNPVREALERELGRQRRELSRSGLYAEVEQSDEQGWRMVLRGDIPALPADWSLSCWPISLPATQALVLNSGKDPVADFGFVSLEAVSAFFAFELAGQQDGHSLASRFVLRLPLSGAPEDRFDHLLRAMLQNRTQFLRLLLLLLADTDMASPDVREIQAALQHHDHDRNAWFGGVPLLESLLRTLDRDPAKLDQVQRLVEDLRRTSEGQELIPEGFAQVWEPIWQTREMLLRGNDKRSR